MTYSQEKIDAYAKLDEAVDQLRQVYRDEGDDDQDIVTGYALLVSSVIFKEKTEDPNDDDIELASILAVYPKRGQNPMLTTGICSEAHMRYSGLA